MTSVRILKTIIECLEDDGDVDLIDFYKAVEEVSNGYSYLKKLEETIKDDNSLPLMEKVINYVPNSSILTTNNIITLTNDKVKLSIRLLEEICYIHASMYDCYIGIIPLEGAEYHKELSNYINEHKKISIPLENLRKLWMLPELNILMNEKN